MHATAKDKLNFAEEHLKLAGVDIIIYECEHNFRWNVQNWNFKILIKGTMFR